jgi:hypothetical protein
MASTSGATSWTSPMSNARRPLIGCDVSMIFIASPCGIMRLSR